MGSLCCDKADPYSRSNMIVKQTSTHPFKTFAFTILVTLCSKIVEQCENQSPNVLLMVMDSLGNLFYFINCYDEISQTVLFSVFPEPTTTISREDLTNRSPVAALAVLGTAQWPLTFS